MSRRVSLRPFRNSSTASILFGLCLLAALCVGVVSALPAAAETSAYGPVAEYSFDEVHTEGEVETVEDLSGGEHTATVHGAEWTPLGRYGGAMEFNGAKGDYLSIPANGELDATGEEFTIEAWVRPTATPSRAAILTQERSGGGARYSYELLNHGEEPLGEFMESEEGLVEGDYDAVASNTWTHLAITDDGAYTRLYVNGVLEDTSPAVDVEGEGELRIGGNGIGSEYFTGRIDEVRIYNRVLGQGEVATDMETPIQTPKAGPVADWSFDENPGEGTTIADSSGNGHTATIHGAKWSSQGKYGGAMEFKEGTYLSVPASPELNLTEEFTLEAWIHPETKHEFDSILTKESGEKSSRFAYLMADHHGQFATYYREYAHAYYSPGEEIKTHIWTHVAVVDDGARIHLYLNGKEVESGPAFEIISTPSGELRIGSSQILEDFIGRIDEVRIYGRALNEAEVAGDMEAPIQTPKAGPVAAYSFDEGEEAGNTVQDVTGDGHTATIEDGIRTKGRYGGGVEFDGGGGNACVTVPDSPELRLSEEFTLEAWVRPIGGVYEDPVVVREAGGKDAFGLGLGSRVEFAPEGFIGQGKSSEAAVGGGVRANEWTPIATTYDGSKIRVYEEGELVAEKSATTRPVTTEGPLKIGCDGIDGEFTGGIDEVRVYNRALTGAEVAGTAETPLQTPKATPVASYSFDEDNEVTQADTSGDGHTATVEGATWTPGGRYGGAMEFQAAKKDVLKIPASPDLNFSEGFTLEAWVRPNGEDNHWAPLIDKQEGSGLGYYLYEGGSVSDRPAGAASEDQEYVHAEDPLPTDTWSHVALVFTGGRTYLFVDGQMVDNGAAEPLVTEEGELEIGGSTDTSDYFNGRIDEVRIYNRPLNKAELGYDMEAPIQTPKRGPIAAWSFEEVGEGGTVEDVTGDGHTGTVDGATLARGKYGEALRFDGENDVVKVPNSPEFALTEGFTLESWVRPESSSSKWAPILAKAIGGGKAAHELAWWLYESGHEPNVPYGGTESAPGEKKEALGEDPLPVNAWSHVALTYDGSQVVLYVNGELVDCSPAPSKPPRVTEGELQIGGATEPGNYFKGRIDEVRIYNRALTSSEIPASMGALPSARTAEAEGVEETEALFTAKINPHGVRTQFRFEYGTTTAYGMTAPEAPSYNEQPESGNELVEVEEWVGELEPETTYHYRVVATSALGTVVGGDQTLTTGEATFESFAKTGSPWNGIIGMNWNGIPPAADTNLQTLVKQSGAKMFRVPIGGTCNIAPTAKEISENKHGHTGAACANTEELFLNFAKKEITILPNLVGINTGYQRPAYGNGKEIPPIGKGTQARALWKTELHELFDEYGPEGHFWTLGAGKNYAKFAPKWWEIWNEPNWGTQGAVSATATGEGTVGSVAPGRFGELLEATHEAVLETGQPVKILFGGVLAVNKESPNPETAATETPHKRIKEFIEKVKHTDDYDALSLHPYAFAGKQPCSTDTSIPCPPITEADVPVIRGKVQGLIAGARTALRNARKAEENGPGGKAEEEKPIWITELGWPVEAADPSKASEVEEDRHHRLVSEAIQAKLLTSTFNMIMNDSAAQKHGKVPGYNIEALLYYNIQDNSFGTPNPPKEGPQSWDNHSGLVQYPGGTGGGTGSKRPAWNAFVNEAE